LEDEKRMTCNVNVNVKVGKKGEKLKQHMKQRARKTKCPALFVSHHSVDSFSLLQSSLRLQDVLLLSYMSRWPHIVIYHGMACREDMTDSKQVSRISGLSEHAGGRCGSCSDSAIEASMLS
jgi:hypothetical protein